MPLASSVGGTLAFEYTYALGSRGVQLIASRGPLLTVVEVHPYDNAAIDASLVEADQLLTQVLTRIDARLATCDKPCSGVKSAIPEPPATDDSKGSVGTCRNYGQVDASFKPPTRYVIDVPCTEPHDIEYVVAITIDDLVLFEDWRDSPHRDEIVRVGGDAKL